MFPAFQSIYNKLQSWLDKIKINTKIHLLSTKDILLIKIVLTALVVCLILYIIYGFVLDTNSESEESEKTIPPETADDTQEQLQHDQYTQLNKIFELQLESFAHKSLLTFKKDLEEHNEKLISSLLNPLKEDINSFREQVNKSYLFEAQERASLKYQIDSLQTASIEISKEAFKLTRALTGDIKSQGAWGELILENVLNTAGLRIGHEYSTQLPLNGDNDTKLIPDVVVHLPNHRNIVIDSKVSLTHYEKYISLNEDSKERESYLKKHIMSLYNHINTLSGKKYDEALNNTVNFVLMFVPVESAFIVAMQEDPDLAMKALKKKVIIVSPTTLLATLKTIDTVWGQYNFNKNIEKISEQNSKVLSKALESLDSIDSLGKQIEKVNKSYDSLIKKLSGGNSSLVGQIKTLIQLSGSSSMIENIKERFNVTDPVNNQIQDKKTTEDSIMDYNMNILEAENSTKINNDYIQNIDSVVMGPEEEDDLQDFDDEEEEDEDDGDDMYRNR